MLAREPALALSVDEMRVVARSSLGRVALLLAVMGASRVAAADNVEACVSAVEEGQKLQRAGRLRAARTTFLACDSKACPAEVRTVCDQLITAVEADLPTVIVGARDAAGNDLVAVRVSVDGVLLSESMDGKAVPIDPGPHSIRFEHQGDAAIDESVVIREAEKRRSIVVTFPRRAAVGVPPTTETQTKPRRPVSALTYTLAAVGVASLGVFIGLDVNGQSRYSSCSGACSSSTAQSLSVERAATLTVGGVGVASHAVATVLFLTRPSAVDAGAAFHLDLAPTRGGGMLCGVASF